MIKVEPDRVVVLIAELDELDALHDDMNPFSLPFLDQTHTVVSQCQKRLLFGVYC
jgi:hypothetical protein